MFVLRGQQNWITRGLINRHVACPDSSKYNDHLTEIAQFNTVPVLFHCCRVDGGVRTFGGYTIICRLQFVHAIQFTCSKRELNHDGKTLAILTAVCHLRTCGVNRLTGAWTFRVPNEKSSDFFLHVVLLLIGESLTDALSAGLIPLVREKGSCR
jgi:hypothetical protein